MSQLLSIFDIHQRAVSPRSLHGIGFVECLRRFAIFNKAIRDHISHPPIRVFNKNGTICVHPFDKILLSVAEIYTNEVSVKIINDKPKEIDCEDSTKAIDLARLGYVATVTYPNSVEKYRQVEGLIEKEIIFQNKNRVSSIVTYLPQQVLHSS